MQNSLVVKVLQRMSSNEPFLRKDYGIYIVQCEQTKTVSLPSETYKITYIYYYYKNKLVLVI